MAPDHFFSKLVSDLLNCATSGVAFGEKVVYTFKRRRITKTIDAIFDDIFEKVDPDTEVVVTSNLITLGIKLSDLPHPPEKFDTIKLRDVVFKVVDVMDDGQGGSELQLHRDC